MHASLRRLIVPVATLGLLASSTLGVFAGHESNNRFDLAPVAGAPAGADGQGSSNYIKGKSTEANEVWNSRVGVTGLTPNTAYSFWAENANLVLEPTVDTLICSFTTGADGDGGCKRNFHPEPAFARARIRLGDAGAIVLEASGSTDADNTVEDGEIERRGDCRSPDQAGGTC